MVLVKKRDNKKIFTYSVVIIVVVVIGGYLVYTALKPAENLNTNVDVTATRSLPIVPDYNTVLFDEYKYQSLYEFGQDKLPLRYEDISKGRSNPFEAPF